MEFDPSIPLNVKNNKSNPFAQVGNEPDSGLNPFDDSPMVKPSNFPLMDQGNQEMDGDEDLYGDDNQNELDRNYSLGGGMMPTSGLMALDSNMSNPGLSSSLPVQMKQHDMMDDSKTPPLSSFLPQQFQSEPEPEVSGV